MSDETPLDRAHAWLREDPDPTTRAELQAILDALPSEASERALRDRFAGFLEFGTAGLRGVLGAGESFMNRAVVRKATLGFARHLLEEEASTRVRARGITIGYDGRRMSREFAEDAAGVFAALDLRVFMTKTCCPTPFAAFASTHLDTAAAVMITASHNPPEYNGYKVYWGNGAQIVPPLDEKIAAQIAAIGPASTIPTLSIADARDKGLVVPVPDAVERAYLDGVRALSLTSGGDRSFPIVYTPLHGVGKHLAIQALREAGFDNVHVVEAQGEPDGEFPTVRFPNPEEKGALDLALALASKTRAELVLANDPDADRLSVAVPGPTGFVQLTGNQIGILLAHLVLERTRDQGDRLCIASCVSTPMVAKMAAHFGARYDETLTGFKWIANRAMELERTKGTRFIFGFEEALGYTVGTLVRDKDGISASVAFAELMAHLRSQKVSLLEHLENLYRQFGLFASRQISIGFPGADGARRMAAVMDSLREAPPPRIGDTPVEASSDFLSSLRRDASGATSTLTLPPSNVLVFDLAGGARIIVRPSGTEPKMKVYLDACEPVGAQEPMTSAARRLDARMDAMQKAMGPILGI